MAEGDSSSKDEPTYDRIRSQMEEAQKEIQSRRQELEDAHAAREAKNAAREAARRAANHSTSGSESGSISVEPQTLEQLQTDLHDFGGINPSLSVDYQGGHTVTYEDFQSFFDDTMSKNRLINSIKYSVTNAELYRAAYVTLQCNSTVPFSYYLSGDRDACLKLHSRLTDEINASKTWYCLIGKYEFARMIITLMTFYFIVAYIVGAIYRPEYAFGIATLTIVIVMFPFWKFVSFMFPKLELQLGRNAKEAETSRRTRQFVFGTVVVGTLLAAFQQAVLRQAGV